MIKYKVNDTVLHGVSGVCRIDSIETRSFSGKKREYYVLKPLSDERSTVYIPTDNEELLSKMRYILSQQQIYDLIASVQDNELVWIENENQRKEKYRQTLIVGDCRQLIVLLKTLCIYKKNKEAENKKIHKCDETFLNDAQKLLYDEFSRVINIKKEQFLDFLINKK